MVQPPPQGGFVFRAQVVDGHLAVFYNLYEVGDPDFLEDYRLAGDESARGLEPLNR